ncbi:DKNYY domain-containing protein [Morganella morganii]|uniref:DKNYY domain-containing protein n=1 Tax=Morganella morganii TaxID=582 RepID=UPI002860E9CF|nr:DKNYY domain-containing protein [Morganella morganii]MDR5684734.1 DKNYY domain-containing protein [Morganella morganii]
MKVSKTVIIVLMSGIMLVSVLFISGVILAMDKTPYYDIDRNGKPFGHSVFTLYDGRVYAAVPSDGYFLIPGADPDSFRLLPDNNNHNGRQFAADKYHVWCGNLPVADFNPQTAVTIGNGYFTDGKNTVFCAPYTRINNELTGLQKLYQEWRYGWGLSDKPLTYYYPQQPLPPSVTPYRILPDSGLVSNGKQVFFDGKLMPEANPETLRPVVVRQNDKSVRESRVFYHDGEHVYYQHHLLPLKDTESLYGFYLGNLFQEAYLFDPQTGQAAMNNVMFPPEYAPYRVISYYGQHVNQGLFLSRNGVYFYDRKKEKIRRAGDNPLLQDSCQEISPLIFTCGNETRYLRGAESWGGRKSPGLISRSTILYRLDDNTTDNWVKAGDITSHHYGEVWQKGGQYFYFDRLGSSQLMRGPIYLIPDNMTVRALLSDDLRVDDLRKMAHDGHLQDISGTEILKATTRYKESMFSSLNFSDDD